jgi:ribosomal protein S27E
VFPADPFIDALGGLCRAKITQCVFFGLPADFSDFNFHEDCTFKDCDFLDFFAAEVEGDVQDATFIRCTFRDDFYSDAQNTGGFVSPKCFDCNFEQNVGGAATIFDASSEFVNCDAIETTSLNIFSTVLGLVSNCTIKNSSATSCLIVGAGAVVAKTALYNSGSGDEINAASSITASVYDCSMPTTIGGNVTNDITTNGNTIDSNITL